MIPEVIILLILLGIAVFFYGIQTLMFDRYIRLQGCKDAIDILDSLITAAVGYTNQTAKKNCIKKNGKISYLEKKGFKNTVLRFTKYNITNELKREIQPYIEDLDEYISIRIEDELDIRNTRIFT